MENGLINLPLSVPWYAPEHHPRKFTFAAAQKCDMFSFGMLCLWFLFGEQILCTWEDAHFQLEGVATTEILATDSQHLAKLLPEYRLLEYLKLESKLLPFAHQLSDSAVDIERHVVSDLKLLFNSTLVVDPMQRAAGFLDLIQWLTPKE